MSQTRRLTQYQFAHICKAYTSVAPGCPEHLTALEVEKKGSTVDHHGRTCSVTVVCVEKSVDDLIPKRSRSAYHQSQGFTAMLPICCMLPKILTHLTLLPDRSRFPIDTVSPKTSKI